MARITDKDLQGVVDRINRVTKSPTVSYMQVDGKLVAQVGNFHLDYAYGGVSLRRMVTDVGGCDNVLSIGYVTKGELYRLMHAFIRGIEFSTLEGN